MDPLMEENFFIENPEQFENNFYNANKKEFQKNFKEKSAEIVKTMSMKKRHYKKVNKRKTEFTAKQNDNKKKTITK